MYPLKISTAITVPFFVHDANGDAVLALTNASFTKRISKDGTTWAAMTVTITEEENGWYTAPFSTAHTDTLGITTVVFTNAGAKQVNLQFRVHTNLPDDLGTAVNLATVDNVVDAILIDTNELGGAVGATISADIAAVKAETALIVADTGTDGVKIAAGEIKTTTFASGAINAAAIATDALTSAKIAPNAIGASELANNAIGANQLADGAITAPTFASGAINAASIATGALTSAKIETGAIGSDELAASAITKIRSVKTGTATGGSTTTLSDTVNLTEADTDYWKGMRLLITNGNNTNLSRLITAFNTTTDTLTFAPALPNAIVAHTWEILAGARVDVDGHTPQTGDSFARLGTPAGADIAADIAANASPTEVLTQVNAALDTAIAEIAQGVPSATPSLRNAAMLMYMALRNRIAVDTTATDVLEIRNDADVVIAKKLVTDDGTIYGEAEMVTGP